MDSFKRPFSQYPRRMRSLRARGKLWFSLQLTFCPFLNTSHQCPSVAQTDLATLHSCYESHLFPSILVPLPCPPHLGDQLISRLDRTRESSLELLDVGGLAPTEFLEQSMAGRIPAEETVHNCTAKSHLLARFGSRVQRVIVAIQPDYKPF
jgi:hypothetical protein